MSDDFIERVTDIDQNLNRDVEISAPGLGIAGQWSIRKRKLHGGLSEGMDAIEVDNGRLSFTVLPTRGMGIWRGSLDDWFVGWNSPVKGPVHPAFVNLESNNGLGWLQGFDEWIVRCGLHEVGAPGVDRQPAKEGGVAEVPVTLHGKIANQPAHRVEIRVRHTPELCLEVVGDVDEGMLFHPNLRLQTIIRTFPDSSRIEIEDVITNLRAQPSEMQVLYHCNFGPPILGEGSTLHAPFAELAPRDAVSAPTVNEMTKYPGPQPAGKPEQAFFSQLHGDSNGQTSVVLCNAAQNKACQLSFSNVALPCFVVWRNPGPLAEGYVTGLEPATSFPNLKTFERENGRVVTLEPRGTYKVNLQIDLAGTTDEVKGLLDRVESLRKSDSTVHSQPKPGWSPDA